MEAVGSGQIQKKALLFQAKKEWTARDAKLLKQVKKMEALAGGCSAVVNYGPNGFSAAVGEDVLEVDGHKPKGTKDVGDILAAVPACLLGKIGAYYDASRRLLVIDGVAVPASIKHRLRVAIRAYTRP